MHRAFGAPQAARAVWRAARARLDTQILQSARSTQIKNWMPSSCSSSNLKILKVKLPFFAFQFGHSVISCATKKLHLLLGQPEN